MLFDEMDLLSNATVVKDAMKFVSEHKNKKGVKEKDSSSVVAVGHCICI